MLASQAGICQGKHVAYAKISVQLIQRRRAERLIDRGAQRHTIGETVHHGNTWAECRLRAIGKSFVGGRACLQWCAGLKTSVVVPGVEAATESEQPIARNQEGILAKKAKIILTTARVNQGRGN